MKPDSTREPVIAEWQEAPSGTGTPAPIHDCWSTIGVTGNGTCRELEKFVHCRNCPVYSAAGLQLLDRALPLEYRRERTLHYAEAKQFTQPAKTSLVLFRLGFEWLALPTIAFQEVAEHRFLHTLPHRRRGVVLGLVNIRGELLICASLARLLGFEEASFGKGQMSRGKNPASGGSRLARLFDRLLVTQWDGQRLVFPVEEVHGIQRFHREEMKPPPATISKSALTYTQGIFAWRERSVGYLNADSLFAAFNRSLT